MEVVRRRCADGARRSPGLAQSLSLPTAVCACDSPRHASSSPPRLQLPSPHFHRSPPCLPHLANVARVDVDDDHLSVVIAPFVARDNVLHLRRHLVPLVARVEGGEEHAHKAERGDFQAGRPHRRLGRRLLHQVPVRALGHGHGDGRVMRHLLGHKTGWGAGGGGGGTGESPETARGTEGKTTSVRRKTPFFSPAAPNPPRAQTRPDFLTGSPALAGRRRTSRQAAG